ncbi:MAG: hypothetical protein M3463_03305 [Verrucomicrobiota bacterium]|nr:hypothetical protein [Verrucomicrobiota bacterium]
MQSASIHWKEMPVERSISAMLSRVSIPLLLACNALAADPLASRYPNDEGIARDPEVLFADDFEAGDFKRWDERRGTAAVSEEAPHAGKYCAAMPMIRGKNTGGDAIKWFMPGAGIVHARCYVKFSKNYGYCHHFLWLSANPRNQKWRSFGKAGLKPDGTYFSTGMEPWFAWGKNPRPGELNFYSYFPAMAIDEKMGKYWGNSFFPPGPDRGKAASAHRVVPALDKWQCWEFMIQANTPGKDDGRQAMWLDGKLVADFGGIRWREDPELKINCFWLQHYGMDSGDPSKQFWPQQQSVWFDDVVIARRYIGPMMGGNQ